MLLSRKDMAFSGGFRTKMSVRGRILQRNRFQRSGPPDRPPSRSRIALMNTSCMLLKNIHARGVP